MRVTHFTEGATDLLAGFDASAARLVALADGEGDTYVSCLHLGAGARIAEPPVTHDFALLVVHVGARRSRSAPRSDAGGLVPEADERYTLEMPRGRDPHQPRVPPRGPRARISEFGVRNVSLNQGVRSRLQILSHQ